MRLGDNLNTRNRELLYRHMLPSINTEYTYYTYLCMYIHHREKQVVGLLRYC